MDVVDRLLLDLLWRPSLQIDHIRELANHDLLESGNELVDVRQPAPTVVALPTGYEVVGVDPDRFDVEKSRDDRRSQVIRRIQIGRRLTIMFHQDGLA
jgi:hypothetical protein